jgi:hypothetical protein
MPLLRRLRPAVITVDLLLLATARPSKSLPLHTGLPADAAQSFALHNGRMGHF